MAEVHVRVEDLRKTFFQKNTRTQMVAIDRLRFDIKRGEIVAIVGRTGCGKSTFFNILMGVERPTSGDIWVDQQRPYHDFQAFKGRMGVVFQQDRLLPWRTVIDNVRLGLEVTRVPEPQRTEMAESWLSKLGLSGFLQAYPSELSGGMRQRVGMARAFALEPEILLADEAFGHLDEVTADDLRREFLNLVHSLKSTTLLITHNLSEALSVGDRVLVFGRPATILADIQTEGLSQQQLSNVRDEMQAMIDQNVRSAS